jgi:hypothetical protein
MSRSLMMSMKFPLRRAGDSTVALWRRWNGRT